MIRGFVGMVAAAVIVGTLAAPAAGAVEELPFSVAPEERNGAPRDYLRLSAEPGATVTDSLVLRNLGNAPLELRLAGVDASTGPQGGASYGLGDSPPRAVGSWVTLGNPALVLAPGASETVDVTVKVPADARSGEHLAGVAVSQSSVRPTAAPASGSALGATVDVAVRRVVAVRVTVPGPADPELVVSGVSPAARPSGLVLLVATANKGHGLTTAEGTIEVPGLGFRRDFHVDTFVPDTSIAYPVTFAEKPPTGRFGAKVELRYGSQVATWQGDVTIGSGVKEELDRRQVGAQAESGRSPQPSSLPWMWFSVATIAGGAGGFALSRRRPRRGSGSRLPPRPLVGSR